MVEKKKPLAFGGKTRLPYKKLIKELNNSFIFVSGAIPILSEGKGEFVLDEETEMILFEVPTIDAPYGMAKRSEKQLEDLFSFYTNNGLYEAFLISMISRFEVFLLDLLRIVFANRPITILGNNEENNQARKNTEQRTIEIKTVLAFDSQKDLVNHLVEEKLKRLGNQGATGIIEFIQKNLNIGEIQQDNLDKFAEVKATRDILVHNENKVNEQYIKKGGEKARAELGDVLTVDADYFNASISIMKKLANDLLNGIDKKFHEAQKTDS